MADLVPGAVAPAPTPRLGYTLQSAGRQRAGRKNKEFRSRGKDSTKQQGDDVHNTIQNRFKIYAADIGHRAGLLWLELILGNLSHDMAKTTHSLEKPPNGSQKAFMP